MPISIMIVDDSPAMRAMIRRVLAISGLAVGDCRDAADGEAALRQLRARSADLVLTDINMPVMNGEDFLQIVKHDEKLRSVSVVVLSTDATAARRRRMLELGAKGYLVKPFPPEALRAELERALGVSNA
jgi:two-component system, chemotaxis family, chemotaxis protein CheY